MSAERAATGCLEETVSFHEHEFMLTTFSQLGTTSVQQPLQSEQLVFADSVDAFQIDAKEKCRVVHLLESSTADKNPEKSGVHVSSLLYKKKKGKYPKHGNVNSKPETFKG